MDINTYMARSLECLDRIVAALEKTTAAVSNITVSVDTAAAVKELGAAIEAARGITEHNPLNAASNQPPFDPESDATQVIPRDIMLDALDKAAAHEKKKKEAEAKEAKNPFKETPNDVTPAAKKVTADDARKALKAFAAREGNDAAMELLTSLGAASVSSLVEQGAEKLAELIKKCEEALA